MINDVKNIEGAYHKDFGFLYELNAFVKSLLKKTLTVKESPPKILKTALL